MAKLKTVKDLTLESKVYRVVRGAQTIDFLSVSSIDANSNSIVAGCYKYNYQTLDSTVCSYRDDYYKLFLNFYEAVNEVKNNITEAIDDKIQIVQRLTSEIKDLSLAYNKY